MIWGKLLIIIMLLGVNTFAIGSSEQQSRAIASIKKEYKEKFKVFKKIGKFSRISFKPQSSPLNFKYDVFYYIPKNLPANKDLNTLVFLHGGGQSTSTRRGSSSVVKTYSHDLIKLADELGFILVMPSGSGINWGSHLLSYVKDLNAVIRKDLPVDPNKIALSGHSMGGMGITISAHWLIDEYAFFLPMAAGIQDNYSTDNYLSTYFNTTYHHLQGLNDHFGIFVTRCKEQKRKVEILEKKYNQKSGFTMEFYQGGHNYDYGLVKNTLVNLFAKSTRNFYQKNLKGVFYYRDEIVNNQWTNGEDIYLAPRNRYFWLKALAFEQEKTVVDMSAKIDGNTINITTTPGLSTLRVYLSNKTVDLTKAITINVDGTQKFNELAPLKVDSVEQQKDPSFIFESYVDIQL